MRAFILHQNSEVCITTFNYQAFATLYGTGHQQHCTQSNALPIVFLSLFIYFNTRHMHVHPPPPQKKTTLVIISGCLGLCTPLPLLSTPESLTIYHVSHTLFSFELYHKLLAPFRNTKALSSMSSLQQERQ